jgi:hypothetical protein
MSDEEFIDIARAFLPWQGTIKWAVFTADQNQLLMFFRDIQALQKKYEAQ